jgi:SAM-dependent methyltransferase
MGVKTFGDYSACYNALYQNKDYAGEAKFVLKRLRRHGAKRGDFLELGCGTGAYTRLFAHEFDSVCGIDLSATMLEQATAHQAKLEPKLAAKITYRQADIRTLRLPRRFDVAAALFHVMSYQVENRDLTRAFASANRHLKKGGLLFFDFWSGPGVLRNLPARRVKNVETPEIEVVRTAMPHLDPNRNTVLVTYDIALRHKQTGRARKFREKHHMRYLFRPELEEYCREAGFEVLEFGEWLTAKTPGLESWYSYLVARKT